jgi:hypothetical protein
MGLEFPISPENVWKFWLIRAQEPKSGTDAPACFFLTQYPHSCRSAAPTIRRASCDPDGYCLQNGPFLLRFFIRAR